MKTVEFYFDFASPNAYMVHRVLPQIAARTDAQVTYKPCLLGGIFKATGNKSPFEAFAGVPSKLAYETLEMERFVQRHDLSAFRLNPHFPVNTLLLMRGAIWAERAGQLADYLEAGMAAMWEAGAPMAEPDAFIACLDAAGLPGAEILAATTDPAIKAGLMEATCAAVERGVFGLPVLFVGDQMYFGKDRLWMVEEILAAP